MFSYIYGIINYIMCNLLLYDTKNSTTLYYREKTIIIKSEEKKQGFTLVELIVVLTILAILAALLIPALTGYIRKAKE